MLTNLHICPLRGLIDSWASGFNAKSQWGAPKMHLNRKRGDGSFFYPFRQQLPFCAPFAFLLYVFCCCWSVFFWRDAEIFYFGCANLHMTARMCVCVLEFWQTLLLNCSASLCWFVGSESERIRAEDPKDKRPDCIPETFLTAAACKIAKIEIAEGPHETKKKKTKENDKWLGCIHGRFGFAYMQFAYTDR